MPEMIGLELTVSEVPYLQNENKYENWWKGNVQY